MPNAVAFSKVPGGRSRGPMWPKEFVDSARALWIAGKSAAQIAVALGVNKDVIIGVAHRNEFPTRPSPIIRKSA